MNRQLSVFVLLLVAATIRSQTTVEWQGYKWHVKSTDSEGPGPNRWDPWNVWVDAKGFLHMKISRLDGRWSCAEIWTDQNLGFGHYQCQVEGALDTLDPNVVFSMFSYAGPDGIKEIDVEYAKWGNAKEKNLWWTVYPNDFHGKKADVGFNISLRGAYTTSRYDWSSHGVHYWMLGGRQPPGSLANIMHEWDYQPNSAAHQVTQTPMPLHFNLWLFEGRPPTDGKPVEIIVHSFQMSPE